MSKFNDIREDKVSFKLGYRPNKKKIDDTFQFANVVDYQQPVKKVILKVGQNENQ